MILILDLILKKFENFRILLQVCPKISILVKMFENSRFQSNFWESLDLVIILPKSRMKWKCFNNLGFIEFFFENIWFRTKFSVKIIEKISISVKIVENSRFQSKLSKNLDFSQHCKQISTSAKTLENFQNFKKSRKISILVKIVGMSQFMDFA